MPSWVNLHLFCGKVKFGPYAFEKLKQWIFQKLL